MRRMLYVYLYIHIYYALHDPVVTLSYMQYMIQKIKRNKAVFLFFGTVYAEFLIET